MHVALIHTRLKRAGGLESRLVNYADWLVRHGHEVTMIIGRDYGDVPHPSGVRIINLGLRHVPKPVREWAFANRVAHHLKIHRYDKTIALSRTPGADAIICPGTHKGYLQALGKRPVLPKDWIDFHLEYKAYRSASTIFAASRKMREELLQHYRIDPSRIRVLYPPTAAGQFQAIDHNEREALRSRWQLPEDKKVLLFVSYSHYRKGLDVLLAAMKRLAEEPIHLAIAGVPVKESLPPNATYLGYVKDMASLYAAVGGLAHPARYEPYGQIITECLQMRKPVLVSGQTGAGELLCPEDGRIVTPNTPAAWQQAIVAWSRQVWQVPPDFIGRNHISMDDHMSALLG